MNYELNFIHVGYLWFILPVLALSSLIIWKTKTKFISNLIRFLILVLLILALAEPYRTTEKQSEHITALLDVSYSISTSGQAELISTLENFLKNLKHSELKLKLIPFAKYPQEQAIVMEQLEDLVPALKSAQNMFKRLDTSETNLSRALTKAIANSDTTSILLLSDGFETQGNAKVVAQNAKNSGVRIFPLIPDEKFFLKQEVSIAALDLPLVSTSGDKVTLRTTVRNSLNRALSGSLEIFLNDQKVETAKLNFPAAQEKLLTTELPELKGGIYKVTAKLKAENFNDEIYKWISTKEKEQVLLLSGSVAEHKLLEQILTLKGYALKGIVAGQTAIPTVFKNFSTIILNNISNQQLPGDFLLNLKRYVQDGGGLIIIGGDKSFGLGGYLGTLLEEISPLKFVPPQTTKKNLNTALILLLDKSRSMVEQNRILAAKNAALASIEALKPNDYIGVIGFDSTPFVVLSLDKVSSVKEIAERRIRNLTASGGTNPFSALSNARAQLQNVAAGRKHIILMSDGQFPLEGTKYVDEIARINQAGITLSTVALGLDVDVPFLKMMAENGKGAFYQSADPNALPQIFLKDIKIVTGEKTMNEDREFLVQPGPSGLLSSKTTGQPSLLGFVETVAKAGANLELTIKKENKAYPLLASWKFGKGMVLAFTSDATNRWAIPWLRWKQFVVFWTDLLNVAKATMATSKQLDFDLRYSINRQAIDFDLSIFDSELENKSAPSVVASIKDPTTVTKKVLFIPNKKGRFVATLEGAKPGDYEVQIKYGDVDLPKLKIMVSGDLLAENQGRGINVQNLSALAFNSGGKVNPSLADVQVSSKIVSQSESWFVLLVLVAFALIFIEAFIRESNVKLLFNIMLSKTLKSK